MPISMPRHGNGYKGFVVLHPDQAAYVEKRAQQERSNNSAIIRRAVDVLMRLEPITPKELDQPVEEVEAAS